MRTLVTCAQVGCSVLVAMGSLLVPAIAAAEPSSPSAVLVVDTSGSMAGTRLDVAQKAIGDLVASVPAATRIGLVTFADDVVRAATRDSSHADVLAAAADMRARGDTALFDAVRSGIAECARQIPCRVVVLSDGADTSSSASLATVEAAGVAEGIPVDVIAIRPDAAERAVLEHLTSTTGGILTTASSMSELAVAFRVAASRVPIAPSTVPATQQAPSSDTASGIPAEAVYVPGQDSTPNQVSPVQAVDVTRAESTVAALPWMAAALAGIAALFVLVAGLSIVRARRRTLAVRRIRQVLSYQVGGQYGSSRRAADASQSPGWVDRADAWLATHVNTSRISARLATSGVALSPAQWLLIRATSCLVLATVLGVLVQSIVIGGVIGAVSGWALPGLWLRTRAARRQRAFGDQLPDFLGLLASSLRAGLSFTHALETAASDGHGEVERQMRRVLREVQVGASLDLSLLECAERMQSDDLRWTVTALAIQREVGGNLSTILDTAAQTIKARHAISTEVRTLSAEGRLSAYVLLGLPLGVMAFLMIFRRPYIEVMWSDPLGILMLIALAGALVTGWFWMRAVVKVKV